MSEDLVSFRGHWVLDPARSAHAGGTPPRCGHHDLRLDGDRLVVSIESVLGSGDPVRTEFVLDLWQDTPMAVGKVDRVRTVIEPQRFCTIAYAGSQAVARAWRILGHLDEMTIVQSAPDQLGV
ncbi:hypothetical protein [Lentzea jiangxiensis]|uniref:Uncharacterized protein n=1 Tax=Lentzea jiangxiensis TaxID=641025 RepID=A0A1H0F5X2_9PSEU|nr:hypothetical protein [Lentzea jiangxiensis]SDN90057.1 hypothetical protein SAMN05421507_101651 [Lentzea jiangxiensis]